MSPDSTIYRAYSDQFWKSPGSVDIKGTPNDPKPPPPPPPGLLWYGTTIFGQSYARYKMHMIGGAGGETGEHRRYRQVEYDTVATIDGATRRGGGVLRVFGGSSPSWSECKPSYVRSNHPICYSWKSPNNQSQSAFKTAFRGFLNAKPTNSVRTWLVFWHEPDNDWEGSKANPNLSRDFWLDANIWCRQVLNEAAYVNRTDIRFGYITVGTPFAKNTATTSNRHWKRIWDDMLARPGGHDDVWDFIGCDRYNPAWDGSERYMTWDNFSAEMFNAIEYAASRGKELPFALGEVGSPRALTTLGQTVLQRDNERADWLEGQYQNMIDSGIFDFACYWRVPATSAASRQRNAWSTQMITPNGYDEAGLAAGTFVNSDPVIQNGGFDAQPVCDIHAKYCLESIAATDGAISYYTGGAA